VTATPTTFSTRRVSSLGIQASGSSAGTSAQRGSPAGLKFFVFTKCIPWCRFSLNLPPPYRAAIQPSGSSRNGSASADGSRMSHLKRIVPAYGSWTPSVVVTSGQTRANSSSTCLRVGRSTPRLRRLRRRYGSRRFQHHVAITGERSVSRVRATQLGADGEPHNRMVNCRGEEFRAGAAVLRDREPSGGPRRVALPHPRLAARGAD